MIREQTAIANILDDINRKKWSWASHVCIGWITGAPLELQNACPGKRSTVEDDRKLGEVMK